MSDMFTTLKEHCGLETALAVVRHFGGMRLYVPKAWTADHMLNDMGEDHARKLIEQFAGEKIEAPRHRVAGPRRTRLIKKLHSQGELSNNEIARSTDCTVRWVRKIVNGEPGSKDESQGDLF